MKVSVTSRMGTVALLGTALAHGSWVTLGLVVAAGIAVSAYCVCAERARRKTLIDLLLVAPTGTVVSQKCGPGGPEMRVQVGEDNKEVVWVAYHSDSSRFCNIRCVSAKEEAVKAVFAKFEGHAQETRRV